MPLRAGFVAIIHAGNTGRSELDQRRQFQPRHGEATRLGRQLVPGLLQFRQPLFRHGIAEQSQNAGNIMRSQHIHGRKKIRGRIILAEARQLAQSLLRLATPR